MDDGICATSVRNGCLDGIHRGNGIGAGLPLDRKRDCTFAIHPACCLDRLDTIFDIRHLRKSYRISGGDVATIRFANSAALLSCRLAWMVSVWRGPSSVPIGELAFAVRMRGGNVIEGQIADRKRFGIARTRTANFFWPLICTCATPVIVDNVGEIRSSAKLFKSGSDIEGMSGQEKGWGIGGIDLAVGRRRGHFRRQGPLGAQQRRLNIYGSTSISRSCSNSRVMVVLPRVLAELITERPEIVENCLSSGVATEEAIVSGLAPGSVALTVIVGES